MNMNDVSKLFNLLHLEIYFICLINLLYINKQLDTREKLNYY